MANQTDHLGNEFASVNQMCIHWNIASATYKDRIKHGWSVERALTEPPKSNKVKDHLGNEFPTITDMCKYYHIRPRIFWERQRYGWTVKECLFGRDKDLTNIATKCTDHLRNEFPSLIAMCNHWNVKFATFRNRQKQGLSIEQCLTNASNETRYIIYDHKGIAYNNIDELCAAYNISKTVYHKRRQAGMTMEKILTTPYTTRKVKTITIEDRTDHNGKVFDSIKDMCEYYNLAVQTYQSRLKHGWSKKDALILDSKITGPVADPYGQIFETRKQLISHYKIKPSAFYERKQCGYSDCESLGIIPLIGPKIKNQKINDSLIILEAMQDTDSETYYFKCMDAIGENLYTRDELLNEYSKTLNIPMNFIN